MNDINFKIQLRHPNHTLLWPAI